MRTLAKLTWVELKLFTREPLTVVFALALPIMVLLVLGGVFGNQPGTGVYRGVGAMDFYTPAYMGLVAASVGLISVPTHLASNRERGVLKRFRASSVPGWVVAGAEIAVALVIASISALVLVAVAMPVYDVAAPDSIIGVVGAFLASAFTFGMIGVFLGSVIPTARAAQALGLLLWFAMLMLAGAGPPPEVMTSVMRSIGEATPLHHLIKMLQQPWLSLDAGASWWAATGYLAATAIGTRFTFRWE